MLSSNESFSNLPVTTSSYSLVDPACLASQSFDFECFDDILNSSQDVDEVGTMTFY